MTKEQSFILGVLSDHINRKKTLLDTADGCDWNAIMSSAHKHQVEGILYYQCKQFVPTNIKSRLAELYASNLFYYSNRERQFKEIEIAFDQEQIPFYTVKGMNVAKAYPIPALRTMGDCDIIVHPNDKEKAHEVMLSLGYKNQLQRDQEWAYFKNKLEFELHDHLLYNELVNSQVSKDFTDLAWDYVHLDESGHQYELDWSFHFVFLILHLKKHFLNSGVGFRQFLDLTVVAKEWPIDWKWTSDILTNLRLLKFTKVCSSLCEHWFDVKMPLSIELEDDFVEAATDKIFENGIFGFDDEQNRGNDRLNTIRDKGKIGTILGRIFPSYKNVRYVPHYSFVNGRPWLLPIVWLYRLVRGIVVGKGTDGLELIENAINSDDDVNNREAILKRWGL